MSPKGDTGDDRSLNGYGRLCGTFLTVPTATSTSFADSQNSCPFRCFYCCAKQLKMMGSKEGAYQSRLLFCLLFCSESGHMRAQSPGWHGLRVLARPDPLELSGQMFNFGSNFYMLFLCTTSSFVSIKSSLLSGSFLIKFSSPSAPTKIGELTAQSWIRRKKKTQHSPAWDRTQGIGNSSRTL